MWGAGLTRMHAHTHAAAPRSPAQSCRPCLPVPSDLWSPPVPNAQMSPMATGRTSACLPLTRKVKHPRLEGPLMYSSGLPHFLCSLGCVSDRWKHHRGALAWGSCLAPSPATAMPVWAGWGRGDHCPRV